MANLIINYLSIEMKSISNYIYYTWPTEWNTFRWRLQNKSDSNTYITVNFSHRNNLDTGNGVADSKWSGLRKGQENAT
jgi:hypothetical protein